MVQICRRLSIVGENKIPPEKRAERLVEIIQQQKETIKSLRSEVRGDDPDLDQLRTGAADALEAGEAGKADDLLAELEEKEESLELEEQLLASASTKADRGRIAMSELRYLDAARHLDAAANKVPRSSQKAYLDYLGQAAWAYYREGDEFGDNYAAAEVIERRRGLLDHYPRERVPLQWARTQNSLGEAFQALAKSERSMDRLEQAIESYRYALEVFKSEGAAYYVTLVENNLTSVEVLLATLKEDAVSK